ncbi:hypothetical protein [Aquimarina acroporae]|uniref:hypothetical protein n=1 Tax=Aquimarina acroporae TaxID=2937283 RepID=UPI0020BF9898|nr:hypothetical protein [Aquimarina acroporae]
MILKIIPLLLTLLFMNISLAQDSKSDDLPLDGKYRYDIAFAEWGGKSMGEKVTVIIKNGTIKVIYEGDGQLSLTKKGDIIDEGKILKHKSGVWIIGTDEKDVDTEEVGGCSNGPRVIDFEKMKFWMC